MKRKLYEHLKKWSDDNNRKPLLIVGARQVGKTWIIRSFCEENYSDWIYINLEQQSECVDIFEKGLDPESILRQLGQLFGRNIDASCTIVIDEIQKSEKAITALKYFCESDKDYRIIGAGSLLGVKINRFDSSFPVGKVEICHMYPMDFSEFMDAVGEQILWEGICEAYGNRAPMAEGIHRKALRLYEDYLYIGGMPEAVADYIANGMDTEKSDSRIYEDIAVSYQADMTKYTTGAAEGVRISEVYRSVPAQLARENPKFKYKEVRANANKRDFRTAIDWLDSSGLVYRVKDVKLPQIPIKAYEDEDRFKLYLSDVGLLSHMVRMNRYTIGSSEPNIYRGVLTENYVVSQFASAGLDLHYFKPDESMEIDLFIDGQDENGLIPVEIKAGRRRRSTSLNNYRKRYEPKMAVRISKDNFGDNNGILTIPLYAVGCIGKE